MDNYYDQATGRWVTAQSRYEAVAGQLRFRDLDILAPERAWPLILELLATVPRDVVSYVGAGPLETFVVRHGGQFIDEIEGEVRVNQRFREAAIEINLERGTLPSDAEARLLVALGPSFALLEPEG